MSTSSSSSSFELYSWLLSTTGLRPALPLGFFSMVLLSDALLFTSLFVFLFVFNSNFLSSIDFADLAALVYLIMFYYSKLIQAGLTLG
jgi:hypothetical protein